MFNLKLTFDDVLLIPTYTETTSRKDISLQCQLTKDLPMNIPLISSNMDTITEDKMAIAMARKGGIGIIHRFCSIQEQIDMIQRVKRAQNTIIEQPYFIYNNDNLFHIRHIMLQKNIRYLIVIDYHTHDYIGIIHKQFLDTQINILIKSPTFNNDNQHIYHLYSFPTLIQTPITALPGLNIAEYTQIMLQNGVNKLPIISPGLRIHGLITLKDIHNKTMFPLMNLDNNGKLRVGAAIGIKDDYIERTTALINAGTDIIVIDIAHGHCKAMIDTITLIKSKFSHIPLIAGNVCTVQGYIDLAKAGADAVKVGIGNSNICSTRLITGFGYPQFSAILDIQTAKQKYGIPIISDGGIRKSADIVKALVAGADTIMMGSILSGYDQCPGQIIEKNGKKGKIIRGMAGTFANLSKHERINGTSIDAPNINPEGIESFSEYKGDIIPFIDKLVNGIKSGISYSGGNMETLKKTQFIQITNSGIVENNVKEFI